MFMVLFQNASRGQKSQNCLRVHFAADRISITLLPAKIGRKRSLQSYGDSGLYDLSEVVMISQRLWCFDNVIMKISSLTSR